MSDHTPHGSGAKGPDELRRQIEHTRGQLGDTVAQLVGRTDVKGRARARAADLRDKAGAMTVQLRSGAAHAGHGVQHRAARAGQLVQDRAAKAGHLVPDRAARSGHAVRQDQRVARPVRYVVDAVLRHPCPALLLGTAGAVAVGTAVLRRRTGSRG